MEVIKSMKKNTVCEVVESCLETVQEGWERTLARVLEWTRHPTGEDALSELARSELVFLMLISALSSLDAEMSSLLLKEVDKWLLFPRITKYMAGKLEAEWVLPREVVDRAAKFAVILERSGMFLVPHELHRYLAQLLLQEEAGGKEDSHFYEQKRPRKDPHGSLSQQGAESFVGGQGSSEGECQVWRDVLVARRRRRRSLTVRRVQVRKRKETPTHLQTPSSPTQEMARPIIDSIVETRESRGDGKKASSHQQGGRRKGKKEKQDPSNQQVPSSSHQSEDTLYSRAAKDSKPSSQADQNPASGALPKVFKVPSSSHQSEDTLYSRAAKDSKPSSQADQNPASGALPKVLDVETRIKMYQKLIGKGPARSQTPKDLRRQLGSTRNQVPSSSHQSEDTLYSRAAKDSKPSSQADQNPASGAIPKVFKVPSSSHQSEDTLYSRAAKENNRAPAQRLLWQGVELDNELMIVVAAHNGADLEEEMGVGGWTPLTEAACYGRLEAVRALISQGAWLEGRGVGQGTALFWAAEMGHEAVVRELIEAGASVRVENSYRATPLHKASVGGHLSTAKLLVEAGADLEAKDSRGCTPLAVAEASVAQYLCSVGAKH